MMSIRRFTLCVLCSVTIAACGSTVDKDLDDANKALNDGDYATAIAKATAVTAADPSNLNAFLLLCSAYSGQAGVDLLELTRLLTDTGTSDHAFNLVHDTLLTTMTANGCATTTTPVINACLDSLNSAITTLSTSFTGTIGNYDTYLQKQYYFQLGILQYVQALGLSTLTAQPVAAGAITPTDITAAMNTTTQTDFIDGYANLTNTISGILATNALATTLGTNYCVLKAESVIAGTATGLNLGVLRDQSLCQLSLTPDTEVTTTVANCAAFAAQYASAACSPGTTPPAP